MPHTVFYVKFVVIRKYQHKFPVTSGRGEGKATKASTLDVSHTVTLYIVRSKYS
jgi:hypothetical protein